MPVRIYVLITVSIVFLTIVVTSAQEEGFSIDKDSVTYDEPARPDGTKSRLFEGRPGRSALFSLVAPGAGQIHNGSYWKAPVVWGVMGGVGAVMTFNIDQFKEFDKRYKSALVAEMDGEPNPDPDGLSSSQLFSLRSQANKNRQLSIIVFSLAWLGQAVEAYVDAHLQDFDISDDLTLKFKPIVPGSSDSPVIAGLGIAISF